MQHVFLRPRCTRHRCPHRVQCCMAQLKNKHGHETISMTLGALSVDCGGCPGKKQNPEIDSLPPPCQILFVKPILLATFGPSLGRDPIPRGLGKLAGVPKKTGTLLNPQPASPMSNPCCEARASGHLWAQPGEGPHPKGLGRLLGAAQESTKTQQLTACLPHVKSFL